ncbi:MAG: hypothetical protein LBK41_09240 [Clostridiales bacterium]|nr:hypothetical protein [Clostridiales bacterium]
MTEDLLSDAVGELPTIYETPSILRRSSAPAVFQPECGVPESGYGLIRAAVPSVWREQREKLRVESLAVKGGKPSIRVFVHFATNYDPGCLVTVAV